MVISNTGGFIFLHVPKAGGTRLTRMLAQEARWNDYVIGGGGREDFVTDFWSGRYGLFKHSLPSEVRRAVGDKNYAAYRKFIVVRDPIQRLRSAYKFFRASISSNASWFVQSPDFPALDGMSSIDEFVSGRYFLGALKADAECASDIQRCILPQVAYLDCDEWQAGRFAHFDIAMLCETTYPLVVEGFLATAAPLDRENASPSFPDTMSRETEVALRYYYRDDYAAFGFSESASALVA
jgi:hypothetical protein